MARLITEGDFRASRYGQMADQIEGRLSDLIEQAESHIEVEIDRKLSPQDYVEMADVGSQSVFVRETPIIEVHDVEVLSAAGEWESLPEDEYQVNHAIGVIEMYSRRFRGEKVRVTYRAGYDPVPAVIKAAVILQTAYFAYQDFEIYGSGDGKPPGITYLQKEVYRYIQPFTRRRLV